MDDFKKCQMSQLGPGGFHCHCCNDSRGKTSNNHVGKLNILNKKARRKIKQQTQKEIEEYMKEDNNE